MGNIKPKVEFEAIELKAKPGWYVLVTLPHGNQPELGNFNTEIEAREWIKRRSPAWLKKYEQGRYAHARLKGERGPKILSARQGAPAPDSTRSPSGG
jgi:hypothetical protein